MAKPGRKNALVVNVCMCVHVANVAKLMYRALPPFFFSLEEAYYFSPYGHLLSSKQQPQQLPGK